MIANRAKTPLIVSGLLAMLALTAAAATAQSPSPVAPAPPAAEPTPASLPPAGRWQVVLTADELIAAGAPPEDGVHGRDLHLDLRRRHGADRPAAGRG